MESHEVKSKLYATGYNVKDFARAHGLHYATTLEVVNYGRQAMTGPSSTEIGEKLAAHLNTTVDELFGAE